MMLIDDPGMTVIEPLLERRASLRPLYDFELMLGGGHLRGWAVEGEAVKGVFDAIDALNAKADGLLYAVGDGNHSLAAARKCWLELRDSLTPEARANHPARFALVELVNLACPALAFEPIHRALFGVDPEALMTAWRDALRADGADLGEGDDLVAFDGAGRTWRFKTAGHPLARLQAFLDSWLAGHPEARIDYIHGEAALRQLVSTPSAATACCRERPSRWARRRRSAITWRRGGSVSKCSPSIWRGVAFAIRRSLRYIHNPLLVLDPVLLAPLDGFSPVCGRTTAPRAPAAAPRP